MGKEGRACNITGTDLKGKGNEGRACDSIRTDLKGVAKEGRACGLAELMSR